MRPKLLVALVAVLAVSITVPALVTAGHITDLKSRMSGKKIVNPGGAKRGRGKALLDFKVKKRKLCFKITYHRIGGQATSGHIHPGKKGQLGPSKLFLFDQGRSSPVEGCKKKVRRGLLKRLRRHPRRHYINLDNPKHPNGAIRGQLKKVR